MALIRPFNAVRYNSNRKIEDHVTQPYDKISPDMLKMYRKRSDKSICNIIRPNADEAAAAGLTPQEYAGKLFRSWLEEKVLQEDLAAGFYPYRQTFEWEGKHFVRTGFIGLCHVEDYQNKVVFPHERTLSTPKVERYALIEACQAHFGVIFLLFEDDGQTQTCIESAMHSKPTFAFDDDFHVKNELWQITDPAEIKKIEALMADKQLFIADGHHRYETSLAYGENHPENEKAQYTLAMFININSELEVLPTHRAVSQVNHQQIVNFKTNLAKCFNIEICESRDAMVDAVKNSTTISIGCYDGAEYIKAELKDKSSMKAANPAASDDWCGLDVAVLHSMIIENILDISSEKVAAGGYVSYHRNALAASNKVDQKDADFAFFLKATLASQLCQVARNGEVMPQKSTDFYPKLLTGMTVYDLS